jgi:hypothetical protein
MWALASLAPLAAPGSRSCRIVDRVRVDRAPATLVVRPRRRRCRCGRGRDLLGAAGEHHLDVGQASAAGRGRRDGRHGTERCRPAKSMGAATDQCGGHTHLARSAAEQYLLCAGVTRGRPGTRRPAGWRRDCTGVRERVPAARADRFAVFAQVIPRPAKVPPPRSAGGRTSRRRCRTPPSRRRYGQVAGHSAGPNDIADPVADRRQPGHMLTSPRPASTARPRGCSAVVGSQAIRPLRHTLRRGAQEVVGGRVVTPRCTACVRRVRAQRLASANPTRPMPCGSLVRWRRLSSTSEQAGSATRSRAVRTANAETRAEPSTAVRAAQCATSR